MTRWTNAAFLNKVGKRMPLFVRFSAVAAEEGYPDTDRDVRGFAVRSKTVRMLNRRIRDTYLL